MATQSRRGGVPPPLAAKPLRTFRARDAEVVYAHPRAQLARLERLGALHRTARGYYVVVPQEYVGAAWLPTLEAAAAGIAAADFGPRNAPLMGISAARLHGAIPRALGTAVVAAPAQRNGIALLDRPGTVQFVKRDTARLDVEAMTTDLGQALVTTPEQTVLDLARRPSLGGAEDEVAAALGALLPRCDPQVLEDLAERQHLGSALDRARAATT
ncbi:MAG: type IV toxin-antitoxin system AbiEi family antitoxin [Actinomycetota bacterium]|nr:type IV toxin-antitoxin system AbiEi family antitoxin [Actinomycetota bacterium]